MNDGRVVANFVVLCKRKGRRKVPFVCLSLPEGGSFYQRFCQCDHSVQNLMVSNNTYIKTFIVGLIGLKLWGFVWFCLLKATVVVYADTTRKTHNGLCGLEGY